VVENIETNMPPGSTHCDEAMPDYAVRGWDEDGVPVFLSDKADAIDADMTKMRP